MDNQFKINVSECSEKYLELQRVSEDNPGIVCISSLGTGVQIKSEAMTQIACLEMWRRNIYENETTYRHCINVNGVVYFTITSEQILTETEARQQAEQERLERVFLTAPTLDEVWGANLQLEDGVQDENQSRKDADELFF